MNAPMNMNSVRSRIEIRITDLRDPGEAARIDAWICGHEDATPFHRPAWMQAVERSTGQEAVIFVAENKFGDISGLLPMHLVHSPLFGRALVSSGFAVDGGILSHSPTATRRLAAVAWEYALRHSCSTVELRGGDYPAGQHAEGWIIKKGAHANFSRALTEDDEAELLAIPRKQRAEIRKGLKNELRVETGRSALDLDWHYAVYSESVRNLGTPVFPKALMYETLSAFDKDADILTVLEGDRPVASVLSLYHNGVVMPYWGGGVWDARRLRANDVMYYSLMNHARMRGCTSFDFGRSKVDSGAYFFKKNWGFEPAPLAYAVRTADGAEPRDVNPNSPKYKAKIAAWQRLPLPVANMLGPWISKGLG